MGAPLDELFREQQEELARLGRLVQEAGHLLATLDLDTLLPRVLELAQRTLEADAYALWRRDASSDVWTLQASDGLSDTYIATAERAIRGNDGRVVALDKPLVAADIASADWLTSEHREAHAAEGTQAFLALPLEHRDNVIGTLVFYYRRRREFSEAEIRSVRAVANLAAAAIGTAQIYAEQSRLAEDRRSIAEASQALSASLEYEKTLANVARSVVPSFADWCAIDMVADDGSIQRLTVAHANPDKVRFADALAEKLTIDPDRPRGVANVVRTGEPELRSEITDEMLADALADRPELLELIRELGLRSSMVVPLVARDRVLGAISFFAAESGRSYTERDLATALDLARRAAVVVDNARLYREAIENERQVRFLAQAGAVFASSLDYDTTLANLARISVPTIADWCIVDVVEGTDIRRVAVASAEEDQQLALEQLRDRFPPTWDSPQPAARALREGGPVIFETFDPGTLEQTVFNPQHLELMRKLDPRSAVALPLVARGETLGAITFAWSRSKRKYGEHDLPLLEDLARRAALSVDNARLYERERSAGERLRFLAEASSTLASSLDYETTLTNVAQLVVPQFADWCAVDLLDEDGAVRRLAVVHKDPAKREWALRSRDLYAPTLDEPEGTARVVRSGQSVLYRRITHELLAASTRDDTHLEVLEQLGMESAMVVPLKARGRTLGALMLVSAEPGRRYDEDDLAFAEHVGRRAATAVDNALLYRHSEQRALAARALAFVGDGVFLVDDAGIVRTWNTAAEVIVGVPERHVVGRRAGEAIPSWSAIVSHVPLTSGPGRPIAESVPVELPDGECWLSISAVAFPGGTVYAFRDMTEERRVERLKSEFISTISHELRTPLAAIYGAALTLRREEPALEAQREGLLDVIAGESERLARIVNDILWASRLESGTLHVSVESCDPAELARTVISAAEAHLPPNVSLQLDVGSDVPPIAADPDKVRQVLTNLVDNAIKYSPDGGAVDVIVRRSDTMVSFEVRDRGLGVPATEQERIFEKFYRLDPELTRGVGGTGLGLYIARELVRRMDGRVGLESREGKGSAFTVELPIAAN